MQSNLITTIVFYQIYQIYRYKVNKQHCLPFKRKIIYWIIASIESFTSLSEIVKANDSGVFQDYIFENMFLYHAALRASFETYFSKEQNTQIKINSWIQNPFSLDLQKHVLSPFPTTFCVKYDSSPMPNLL